MARWHFYVLLILCIGINAPESQSSLKFTSYNIRNFDADSFHSVKGRSGISTDTSYLAKVLKNNRADIVAVQEIVNKTHFVNFIRHYFPQYQVVLTQCGGAHRQHLGFVFSRHRFQLKGFTQDMRLSKTRRNQQIQCYSGSRPAAIAVLREKNSNIDFVAMSVHLKSGGTKSSADKRFFQYQTLTQIIKEWRARGFANFAIMGDFNTTNFLKRNHYYHRFVNFLKQNRLSDFSASGKCSSYWHGGKNDGKEYPSMLDHVLLSGPFLKKVRNFKTEAMAHCQISQCQISSRKKLGHHYKNVSDHCPISVSLF